MITCPAPPSSSGSVVYLLCCCSCLRSLLPPHQQRLRVRWEEPSVRRRRHAQPSERIRTQQGGGREGGTETLSRYPSVSHITTCLSHISAGLTSVPVCVSGAVVLRVPVLFGDVESVSESAVTCLWLWVQGATESCTLDHCQQRFPTDTRDVAAVCRKLSERARQVLSV